MIDPKQINALITLLDDGDREVFEHVEAKLMEMGNDVIPILEKAWENKFDPTLQSRIENVIHKIQFDKVKAELGLWALQGGNDLLKGFILVSRYQYPDLDEQKIQNTLEAIKREVWIELAFAMSPIEKIKVLNHILYSVNGFSGNVNNYKDPQNSYINIVLETRTGNQISLAIIYAIIAEMLDIPVFGVNLPQHFILAFVDKQEALKNSIEDEHGILFYINAFNKGFIFSRKDIDYFLRQLKIKPNPIYYEPCTNIDIIKRVLRNLKFAYESLNNLEKADEVNDLLTILESDS